MNIAYVCVIEHEGTIYKFDNKFYATFKAVKKRCDYLNKSMTGKIGYYKVFKADNWYEVRF